MTEVQTQAVKPLDAVAEDLAGQVFDAAGERFISELKTVNPAAAERVAEALKAARAEFTPEAAREIKELKEAGDEASLRKALGQVEKLRSLLDGGSAALETEVTAETILQGFKKLDDGVIELTLPVGTTIQEAGTILNAAATTPVEEGGKGMEDPVFYEGSAKFWAENEANADLQTVPGRTYQFKIPTDSVSKTRADQVREYGEGAPLGAIAIAEACERLNTDNKGTLFRDADGNKVWVRGSAPGVVLNSNANYGVYVDGSHDDYGYSDVAFASSVSARN